MLLLIVILPDRDVFFSRPDRDVLQRMVLSLLLPRLQACWTHGDHDIQVTSIGDRDAKSCRCCRYICAIFFQLVLIFGPFWVILGYFGYFLVIFGPFFGANFFLQNMHLCYLNRFLQLCSFQPWFTLESSCLCIKSLESSLLCVLFMALIQ